MTLRQFKNITTFQSQEGKVLGFHNVNMEVAELDALCWSALEAHHKGDDHVTEEQKEALADLELWSKESATDVIDYSPPSQLKTLTVNVSQICNLACQYCGAGGDGTYGSAVKKLALDKFRPQLKYFLDRALEATESNGPFTLNFIGGEPLIYPDVIRAIVRESQLMIAGQPVPVNYQIVTNGTLITPEIADFLGENHFSVSVSIDGPPEVNDSRRPAKGGASTEKTLQGLKELGRVKDQLTKLNAAVTIDSHYMDLTATYEFLSNLPFDTFFFEFAAAPGDEAHSDRYGHEVERLAQYVYDSEGEDGLMKILNFNNVFHLLDNQVRRRSYCGAGKSLLTVDTSNRLYACVWFSSSAEESLGQGVQLDEDKRQREYAGSLIDHHNCQTCWARYLCGGGCMFVNKTKTGDKHQKDLAFCQRQYYLFTTGVRFYEKIRNNHPEEQASEVC